MKPSCLNCTYEEICVEHYNGTGKLMCDGYEDYANQDYIGCKECSNPLGDVSDIFENVAPEEWPIGTFDKHRLVILFYFVDKLQKPEIVGKTGYSLRHINRIISAALAKIIN